MCNLQTRFPMYLLFLVLTIFRGLTRHLSQSSIIPSIYFSSIVKSRSNPVLNQPVLINKGKVSCSRKQQVPLIGLEPTTSNDLWLRRVSIPNCIHYIYFLILILEKEPVFPFWMFSAKQGYYWYHFYNVFVMIRSLTGDWTRDLPHSMPALYR